VSFVALLRPTYATYSAYWKHGWPFKGVSSSRDGRWNSIIHAVVKKKHPCAFPNGRSAEISPFLHKRMSHWSVAKVHERVKPWEFNQTHYHDDTWKERWFKGGEGRLVWMFCIPLQCRTKIAACLVILQWCGKCAWILQINIQAPRNVYPEETVSLRQNNWKIRAVISVMWPLTRIESF
jgi:hypothetical protein